MNRIKEVLEEKGIKQKWLAERMAKSYNMINSYVQNRRQPSIDDLFKMARILGVDVREMLKTDYLHGEESFKETTKVPLLGDVSCGLPIFAQENIEAQISVSNEILKKGHNYFLLKAKGDSMDLENIKDGDLVLIRQQQIAQNGDIVLALIEDDATIKEFQFRDNIVVLKPKSKNPKHQPIILTSDLKIQGVVEAVIPY